MPPGAAVVTRVGAGYVLAIFTTVLAAGLRWSLDPLLGGTGEYLTFYFSVLFVAIVAGLGPGVVAIVLGAFLGKVLFVQLGHLSVGMVDYAVRLVLFVLYGATALVLVERSRRSEARSGRLRHAAQFPEENPNPVFRLDAAGGFLYANEACSRMLSWNCRPGAEAPEAAREAARVALQNEQPSQLEIDLVGKDGRVFSFTCVGVPHRQHANFYGRDVTDARRAHEEVERERARWKHVVEGMADEVWVCDVEGRMGLVNLPAVTHMGLQEFQDKSVHQVLDTVEILNPNGEVRAEQDAPLLRALAGETVRGEEIMRDRRTGHERQRQFTAAPIRDGAGAIVGSVAVVRDVTDYRRMDAELHQANERLRESEQRLALALEAGGHGAWQVDLETNTVVASPRVCDIFGVADARSSTQLGGWFDLIVEEDRAANEQAIHDAESGYGDYKAEFRVRRASDGALRWVQSVGKVTVGPDGRSRLLVGMATDVTERKEAEEALRIREHDLHRAQAAAHLGSWRWDIANDVVSWSEELYRIFGVDSHTFVPSNAAARELIHPDDREVHAQFVAAAFQGKKVAPFESRIIRPSGEERVVMASGFDVEFDRAGTPVVLFGTILDITERKRAEEALVRSREGLGRLAEASMAVMAKTSLDDMLQAISEAALALTGARLATCGHGFVSGQYVVGGSARVPGAPECPPGEMFRLDKGGVHMALVEGAESIHLTDAELRADAGWWGLPEGHVPMRGLLGVRMAARDGRTNGVILVTDKESGDFTAEDETLLKQLATVASLALQHVETRISLEEADRRKNEFMAMLSHELRNPLAPIRHGLYVLGRGTPGGEQALRAQAVIDRQVGHLTRLVDDLLDVTRISRGKIQLQRERVDLTDLVSHVVEDYREAFAQNRLAIDLVLPEHAVWVWADRTRLGQVIGNLLSNSAKFTPAGGRAIISVESNTHLAQALVTVQDTGIGIAPEMLPRVFEPFAQADSTLDRRSGGLGLGLAMVKGLVEMHGGTASVESSGVGEGARFTIRLPLDDRVDSAPMPSTTEQARGNGGQRILVIEDNTDAAEMLRVLLELNHHTVALAFSGPEGIEKAREFGPDVVLCDIGLPGMNGYEVAQTIRQDAALRRVRLVALTGYAGTEDIARARNAGFDAHVAKPPSPERLEEILTRGQNERDAA